jgi:hypothetical protein
MGGQPETIVTSTIDGEIMSRGIDHDLFASLMRLSARERTEILEFLGQSPVDRQSVATEAYSVLAQDYDDRLSCGSSQKQALVSP